MKKLILCASLAAFALINLACKCGWGGNFLRVGPFQDLVVKAKVIRLYKVHSDIYEKMEVEIIKTFKGIEKRKHIMVWGDDGKSCRPYISNFKKGQTYYLALNPDEETKGYEISVCGEYYLEVKNGRVQLHRNEGDEKDPEPMDLGSFEKALAEKIK